MGNNRQKNPSGAEWTGHTSVSQSVSHGQSVPKGPECLALARLRHDRLSDDPNGAFSRLIQSWIQFRADHHVTPSLPIVGFPLYLPIPIPSLPILRHTTVVVPVVVVSVACHSPASATARVYGLARLCRNSDGTSFQTRWNPSSLSSSTLGTISQASRWKQHDIFTGRKTEHHAVRLTHESQRGIRSGLLQYSRATISDFQTIVEVTDQ